MNHHVYDQEIAGRFVTLLITLIDPKTHLLTLANAGHNSALIRRAGGHVDEIKGPGDGPPLGVMRDISYFPTTVELSPWRRRRPLF